jgi:DMSO/TMAO reductase YedYZ molybdopterin-dependent catalytic subunit
LVVSAIPLSLLIVQLVFTFVFYLESSRSQVARRPVSGRKGELAQKVPAAPPTITRRSFVEKGLLGVGVLALAITSLDKLVTTPIVGGGSTSPAVAGTPVDLQDAPAIFQDPRLASLVDYEITPNNSFYRVAIDLFDPSVDPSAWSLDVGGLVGNAKSYTLSSFMSQFSPVDLYNTFECVSNLINGNLIGNAKWTGVRVSDVLNDAGGVGSGASYVVFYSVDGYSVAIPLSKAMAPESILAFKMNDEALPQKHGYPLRAVIPGLYGMMSAKWVRKIQVVNSHYEGYWQTRGWSDVGTVQTVAFVSIPGNGSSVSLSSYNGSVVFGGIAYAGDRGISKVEVSTDGGKTWQTAELKKSIANQSWTLWAIDWRPSKTGSYAVYARATDGTGQVQTVTQSGTFPNGATGYAIINVNLES